MDLLIKRFKLFLLIFAALVFNAHMIIPHDHHAVDYDVCQGKSTNSGSHRTFPGHCHAFNDLPSEKAKLVHISQKIQFSYTFLYTITDSTTPDLQINNKSIIAFQRPIFCSITPENSQLRAPPSFA
jgi:hypothetical protein